MKSITPPTVTKPWSNEMYEWNEMVANLMKAELFIKINEAEKADDRDTLNELHDVLGGGKFGEEYTIGEIWERCLKELERVPNYWLNEEWEYAVNRGLVSDCVKIDFVGY
jgi:hypothetical protein